MSDTTPLIAVGTGTITIVVALLGHTLGQLHRLRDDTAERDRRIAALDATLSALAEDYDPIEEESPGQRKRRLPEGWSVINGGRGVLIPLALLGSLIRRHRRIVASGMVGAGVAAIVAGALLAHGAPPGHHTLIGPIPPTPTLLPTPIPTATASPLATPVRRTPRRSMPPPIVVPIRPRRSATAAPTAAIPSGPPPPQGSTGAPAPSAAPSHTPTPVPTPPAHTTQAPACPIGLSLRVLRIGIVVCI